jgi:excisionase family DNA binding protein
MFPDCSRTAGGTFPHLLNTENTALNLDEPDARPILNQGGMFVQPMLMTAKDVADLTGLPEQTIYRLARNRQIPHKRLGKRQVRFPREAVIAWAKAGVTLEANMCWEPEEGLS